MSITDTEQIARLEDRVREVQAAIIRELENEDDEATRRHLPQAPGITVATFTVRIIRVDP
jgi:hypothetical protein